MTGEIWFGLIAFGLVCAGLYILFKVEPGDDA